MNELNYNKRACQEGALAFIDGTQKNPYIYGSQSQRRWDRGYRAQKTHNIVPVVNDVVEVPTVKKVAKKTVKKKTA